MFISCSTENKIFKIPEEGSAVVSGYWSPDIGSYIGSVLLEWKNGKVFSLQPSNSLNHLKVGYVWDAYTLMPGWLDAHVHLALDSLDFYKRLENWKQTALIETDMQRYLISYLEHGIVGIRDGGDLPGFSWLAKNRIMDKQWLGPHIVSVHEAVSRAGMYGRFLGRGFRDIYEWRESKKDFFAQEIDQFKIIVTGLIRFDQYGVVGPIQWSVDDLKELVESAHFEGISVMAHASGADGISVAISAGVDSIEHGYFVTRDQLEEMKAKNIAWIPTVAPIGNLLKYPTDRYSSQVVETLERILETHLTQIYNAYQLNVRIGIGTDAGAYRVPHAAAFYDEMAWMNSAGIPWHAIYQMATHENARILGRADLGGLKIGSTLNTLQLVNREELDNIFVKYSYYRKLLTSSSR
jgi:imidazolonepropionase-like amidohydrolase